ncbi:unnamed protein product, partial [Polarella glacialis]
PQSAGSGLHRASSTGNLQRPQSAGSSRSFTPAPGLKDFHYEAMKKAASTRQELMRETELQREPWTAPTAEGGRNLPRRPFSAIVGYTGFRPRKEDNRMVGRGKARSCLEARRIMAAEN